MSGEMRRIEKTITVNIGTLKAYGSYCDKIVLPELDAYIALTVVEEKRSDITTNELRPFGLRAV